MAILIIPDDIFTKLQEGEIAFTDLEEYQLEIPETEEVPRVYKEKPDHHG